MNDFETRLARQNKLTNRSRQGPETDETEFGIAWTFDSGRYNHLFFKDFFDTPLSIECVEGLSEVEILLVKIIKDLVEKRGGGGKPIVCVDIGGMYGISMLKIAQVLEKEIQLGLVELIVTNLNFIPYQNSDFQGSLLDADREVLQTVFEVIEQGLVKFIRADLIELSVRLLLEGKKIDLVHEFHALMHGYTNDRDLGVLASSLSEEATVLLQKLDMAHMQDVNTDELRELRKARFDAHQKGLVKIRKSGALEQQFSTQSPYEIFGVNRKNVLVF